MNINNLRYFIRVVNSKGYTSAAKAEYMSTSAIFRSIRVLETELGVKLLEKVNRQIIPTEAGAKLYHIASGILDEYNNLKMFAATYSEHNHGSLQFGTMINTYVEKFVLNLIYEFNKKYPNCEVCLRDFSAANLEKMLIDQELDIALVPVFRHNHFDEDTRFNSLIISQDVLSPVMRRDNPLSNKKALNLVDISSNPLILPCTDPPEKDVVLSNLAANRLLSSKITKISSYLMRLSYVNQYNGITFYPFRFDLPSNMHNLIKVPFDVETRKAFEYKYTLLSLKSRPIPIVSTLFEMVRHTLPLG